MQIAKFTYLNQKNRLRFEKISQNFISSGNYFKSAPNLTTRISKQKRKRVQNSNLKLNFPLKNW